MEENKEKLNNKQDKKEKKTKEHKQSKHPKLKLISLIIVVLILLVIDSIIIYNKLYEKHLLDMHFEPSELNFLLVEIEDQGYITTHYYIFGKNGLCQGGFIESNHPVYSSVDTSWGWGYINLQTTHNKNYIEYTGFRGHTQEELMRMHSNDNIIRMIEF